MEDNIKTFANIIDAIKSKNLLAGIVAEFLDKLPTKEKLFMLREILNDYHEDKVDEQMIILFISFITPSLMLGTIKKSQVRSEAKSESESKIPTDEKVSDTL